MPKFTEMPVVKPLQIPAAAPAGSLGASSRDMHFLRPAVKPAPPAVQAEQEAERQRALAAALAAAAAAAAAIPQAPPREAPRVELSHRPQRSGSASPWEVENLDPTLPSPRQAAAIAATLVQSGARLAGDPIGSASLRASSARVRGVFQQQCDFLQQQRAGIEFRMGAFGLLNIYTERNMCLSKRDAGQK